MMLEEAVGNAEWMLHAASEGGARLRARSICAVSQLALRAGRNASHRHGSIGRGMRMRGERGGEDGAGARVAEGREERPSRGTW
jgi:hypothetical protein